MATGKQEGRPAPVKETKGKSKGAKEKVEKMFRGDEGSPERPTDATNDRLGILSAEQPMMKVDAVIPLPGHAEVEPDNPSVRDIKDRVDALFDSIGTEALPETAYPRGKDNKAPAAAEFVVAEQLKKRAEKRYNRAKEEADAVGCFGLQETHVAGETVEVYRSPHFTFAVKKGEETMMVNKENTIEVLRELAPGKWQELLKRCMKPRAGPTQIITALK
jgi:hypothetical protein